MGVKRSKRNKRDLTTYRTHFGFYEPYKIVIDGTFLHSSLSQKLDINENLSRILQGTTQTLITPCALNELNKLGDELKTTTSYARRNVKLLKCYHPTFISARECILSCIGNRNKKRFCCATQDKILRKSLAAVPGVPLIYLNNSVTILEPISTKTQEYIEKKEFKKTQPMDFEKKYLEGLKESEKKEKKVSKKRRKKKGNPNPLSCLKSKKRVY